tara:strand:+ start:13 stop:348 length:336 start_codon:yes stop_codon:yes gene_type:complete
MHNYNHQDWDTVILNKKSKSNNIKKNNFKTINKVINYDAEPEKQKFISLSNSRLIQQARCNQNLTQKQLANQLNVEQKLIQCYESGKVVPNYNIMIQLENILKIKLDKKKK